MGYFPFRLFEGGLEIADLGMRQLEAAIEAHGVGLKLAAVTLDAGPNQTDRRPRAAEIRISDERANLLTIVEVDPTARLIDPSLGSDHRTVFERLVRRAQQAQARAQLAWMKTIHVERETKLLIERAEDLLSQPVLPHSANRPGTEPRHPLTMILGAHRPNHSSFDDPCWGASRSIGIVVLVSHRSSTPTSSPK